MNVFSASLKDVVLSADPINDTPVIGVVKSYITDALRPKSPEHAAYTFHRNLMGIKIVFLLLVFFAAIFNQLILYRKQSGKTHVLKKPLFWVECLVVGLSTSLPTILLFILRDKHMITNNNIDWNHIITKTIVVSFVFFIANILFELAGVYASFYDKENEKQIDTKDDPKTPNERFRTSFINAILTLAGLIVIIVVVNMIWCAIVAKDTTTNYNFGLESHKWIVFVIEMILFAIIGSVPVYLIAQNRSGKISKKITANFGMMCLKFIIIFLGLQLSGTFTYWFDK
jgi:hypothetical protein